MADSGMSDGAPVRANATLKRAGGNSADGKVRVSYGHARLLGLLGGPLAFAVLYFLDPPQGMSVPAWRAVGLTCWMAIWWMTEAVPLAVTALLPIVVLPLAGVFDVKKAVYPYASPAVFLFMGGFIIAIAMERWTLHIRIALTIIRAIGYGPGSIIGGFMVATAILSMWMSNTATAVLMLPIGMSVVHMLMQRQDLSMADMAALRHFAAALMLAIGYSATIGGMGTLVGTVPNIMLAGFMQSTYGIRIDFVDWMIMAMPVVVAMLVACWLVLTKLAFRFHTLNLSGVRGILANEARELGPMSRPERMVLAIFLFTALLWVFKRQVQELLGLAFLDDTTIALLGATLLFVTPVNLREGRFLLSWREAERLPWGMLILFGGGLSLANALGYTGFAKWVGQEMENVYGLSLILLLLLTAVLIMAMTEFLSNIAVMATFLPIIAAIALGFGQNPLLLMIPATLAASCAFMLPVSTPPNAIVFGSGFLRIPQMMKAGILLNLLGIGIILAAVYLLAMPIFGLQEAVIPDWAYRDAAVEEGVGGHGE